MTLPSLGQYSLRNPDSGPTCSIIPEYRGSEDVQQSQAGIRKKEIDPADFRLRPTKEEALDAVAVIDRMSFGASRRDNCREEPDSETWGARIGTFPGRRRADKHIAARV